MIRHKEREPWKGAGATTVCCWPQVWNAKCAHMRKNTGVSVDHALRSCSPQMRYYKLHVPYCSACRTCYAERLYQDITTSGAPGCTHGKAMSHGSSYM